MLVGLKRAGESAHGTISRPSGKTKDFIGRAGGSLPVSQAERAGTSATSRNPDRVLSNRRMRLEVGQHVEIKIQPYNKFFAVL